MDMTANGIPATRLIAARVPVSREMLRLAGLVEPTAEEREEDARYAAAWAVRQAEAEALLEVAMPALAALSDPGVRAVLDLHHRTDRDECAVDMWDTEMGDHADWPCVTVRAIAEAHGITLPD